MSGAVRVGGGAGVPYPLFSGIRSGWAARSPFIFLWQAVCVGLGVGKELATRSENGGEQ